MIEPTDLTARREQQASLPDGPPEIEFDWGGDQIIFRDQDALDEYVRGARDEDPWEHIPHEVLTRMFNVAPRDWWRFVRCEFCNALRRESCGTWDEPRRTPHVNRYRTGLMLHGTLWLLANGFESDVLGDEPGETP